MYIIYMVVVGIWSCLVYIKIKNKSRSSRHMCLRRFSHRQDGISDYTHHRQSTHHHLLVAQLSLCQSSLAATILILG